MSTDAGKKPPAVYRAIVNVMQELAQTGIAKSQKNKQQGWSFRGIDDLQKALAGPLSKHGLVILVSSTNHSSVERPTKGGGVMIHRVVDTTVEFISADDGSRHVISFPGESADTSDKAMNKAMTAAMKYACFLSFCIPVEGIEDADETTHELQPVAKPAPSPSKPAAKKPDGEHGTKLRDHIRSLGSDAEPMTAAAADALVQAWFKAMGRHGKVTANEVCGNEFQAAEMLRHLGLLPVNEPAPEPETEPQPV